MRIVILREVNTDDPIDLLLVLLVHLHELLDVPVVSQRELSVGQDWRIEFEHIHVDGFLGSGFFGRLLRFCRLFL